jgi:hypothetical protein
MSAIDTPKIWSVPYSSLCLENIVLAIAWAVGRIQVAETAPFMQKVVLYTEATDMLDFAGLSGEFLVSRAMVYERLTLCKMLDMVNTYDELGLE